MLEACLDRIAERDALIGAWAHLDPALARAQAAGASARGPLQGLPVGVKDVLTTRDMPTQYGCELYRGHFPAVDAAVVAMLRAAGAIILGKTATVELAAIGEPPRTRNPRAPDRTPGGSSSGSAAAVADGQVPIALGTQTGGSIIRPASFCGVWALKPSWGTVSTEGAKPFAPSLDTIGWFGRTPADLALLLDVLTPPAEPAPAPRLGRIGIWRTSAWHKAEAATRDALAQAIALLGRHGVNTVELDLASEQLTAAHRTIMYCEGQRSFLTEYRAAPDKLHPRIADMVRTAGGYTSDDLRRADAVAADARLRFDDAAAGFDAILGPSTIGEAPRGLDQTGDMIFNAPFSLLHAPCVNMPLFAGPAGLPVGLTLSAPRFADRRLLAVAAAIHALSTSGAPLA